MSVTDLLIIYLAFGAPIAVYKYLQNGSRSAARRIASSVLTFFFWIPSAVRIGYLYFTNADLRDAFVSPPYSDAAYKEICSTGEALSTELIRTTVGLSVHDVRRTTERYAGLAEAVGADAPQDERLLILFAAAGRKDEGLGLLCLTRRNRHRLERHHLRATQDLLDLFEYLAEPSNASIAYHLGMELTDRLGDKAAFEQFRTQLTEKVDNVWTPEQVDQSKIIFSEPIRPLNSDGVTY